MTPRLQIPTGSIHSFKALAHPLLETARQRLKQLATAICDAETDAKQAANDALDDYTRKLREDIWVEFVRRGWSTP